MNVNPSPFPTANGRAKSVAPAALATSVAAIDGDVTLSERLDHANMKLFVRGTARAYEALIRAKAASTGCSLELNGGASIATGASASVSEIRKRFERLPSELRACASAATSTANDRPTVARLTTRFDVYTLSVDSRCDNKVGQDQVKHTQVQDVQKFDGETDQDGFVSNVIHVDSSVAGVPEAKAEAEAEAEVEIQVDIDAENDIDAKGEDMIHEAGSNVIERELMITVEIKLDVEVAEDEDELALIPKMQSLSLVAEEVECVSEAETKSETESESELEFESESKPEFESESKPEFESESKTETKTESQFESESDRELEDEFPSPPMEWVSLMTMWTLLIAIMFEPSRLLRSVVKTGTKAEAWELKLALWLMVFAVVGAWR